MQLNSNVLFDTFFSSRQILTLIPIIYVTVARINDFIQSFNIQIGIQ